MIRSISEVILRKIDGYHTGKMPPDGATGSEPARAIVIVAASAIALICLANIKPHVPPLAERTPAETEAALRRIDGTVRKFLLWFGLFAAVVLFTGLYIALN